MNQKPNLAQLGAGENSTWIQNCTTASPIRRGVYPLPTTPSRSDGQHTRWYLPVEVAFSDMENSLPSFNSKDQHQRKKRHLSKKGLSKKHLLDLSSSIILKSFFFNTLKAISFTSVGLLLCSSTAARLLEASLGQRIFGGCGCNCIAVLLFTKKLTQSVVPVLPNFFIFKYFFWSTAMFRIMDLMICKFVSSIFMSDWFLFAPRYGLAKAIIRFDIHDTSRNVRTTSKSRKTPCPWILKTPKIDSGRQERQLPYEPPEELELRLGALSFDNHRTSWASSASADGHLYLRSPAGYPFSRARGAVMMPFFEWYIYDGLYVVNAKPAKQTSNFFVGFLNLKFQKHISCFRAGTELWWCHP